jgi:hypothetical protein
MKICRSVYLLLMIVVIFGCYQHVEGRGIFKAYNRRPGSGHARRRFLSSVVGVSICAANLRLFFLGWWPADGLPDEVL